MRHFTLILLIGFMLLQQTAGAQSREFPNAIHAKLNFFDYGSLYNGEVRLGQGFEIGYFRNVAPFLNVGVPFKLGLAKLPEIAENTVTTSLDVVVHLQNMRDEVKVSPYAFGGAGFFTEKFEKGHVQVTFGAGLNFRISKFAFVNLQGEFRKAFVDNRDNIQLGAGFVYLLHKSDLPPTPPPAPPAPLDTDRDSIPDVLDKCPNEPGPASALGCPDADGDGVADVEDQCPDLAGLLETSGCPDGDGDGFADKDDLCPSEPGRLKGCPDADKDGFADKDDECPTIEGRWNGCPDADYDGVPDKDDQCPDQAGTAANKGCPENTVKDADNDGIADAEDLCPTTPGKINGCPDTDGDGIADKDDSCPDQSGPASNKGCPIPSVKDSDNDGVADKDDPCPTTPGKVNGCPDTDGDGLVDKDDPCPKEAGKVNGCPDTDGDGLVDKDDPCPKEAGKVNGCPDTDGDGLVDKDDRCPDQAGPLSNNGCPIATVKDSDGDGVADKDDPCPNKAGKFNGCPDTDGDGVADNLDKCPTNAGPASNNGCPEVKKETKERLAFATKAIQFETGKASLKKLSFPILDEIVDIMRQYPDYTLSISGHTDDVGDEESNLQLSKNRAKTCYDYFIFRGIKPERLRHAGFGEERPIVDGASAEAREMNRRVEFELILQ